MPASSFRTVALGLVALLPGLEPAAAQDPATRPTRGADELEHFRFAIVGFDTPSTPRERGEYGIYLPAGYDAPENAERRYPWVLWLHGMRGDLHRFRRSGAAVLDGLAGKQAILDLIVVTPSCGGRPTYMNEGRGGDEEDRLLLDLRQHVEKHYRVGKARHHRAIMGVSMGALGAMRLALRHPDVFAAVAVHSSPVLPLDPEDLKGRFERYATWMGIRDVFGDPIDPAKWRAEIPTAILTAAGKGAYADLAIYFDAGSADRYGFGPGNQELSRLLDRKQIRHTFRFVQDGGHSWSSGAVQAGMLHSFPFISKALDAAAQAAALEESEQPEEHEEQEPEPPPPCDRRPGRRPADPKKAAGPESRPTRPPARIF